jgi:Tfp pilus assembly protein PilX
MNSKRTIHPSREQGQTLVIAVIILGILLILGTAFAGIVSRNITEAGRAAQRTVGTDLAEAGARLAHTQLLNSELGADWRPALTTVAPMAWVPIAACFTKRAVCSSVCVTLRVTSVRWAIRRVCCANRAWRKT